jgi:hypothetical protein
LRSSCAARASCSLHAAVTTYCSATIPTLANAVADTVNASNGATNTYTCNAGYQSNGATSPFYTCNEATHITGQWSSVIYSCEKITTFCPSSGQTTPNADTPTPVQTINNSTYFTCNVGFEPSGGITPYYTCTDNSGTGTYSAVTSGCDAISSYCTNTSPTLLHTTGVTSPSPINKTFSGSTSISCNTGYTSTGGASINPFYTCYADNATNGQWSEFSYSCERMCNHL